MKILNISKLCALALVLSLGSSCCKKQDTIQVIPLPQEISLKHGSFNVSGARFDVANVSDPSATDYITEFALLLAQKAPASEQGGVILFEDDATLAAEEYLLNVSKSGIQVKASSLAGYVYAIQTIKQLLPISIWETGCCSDCCKDCCSAEESCSHDCAGCCGSCHGCAAFEQKSCCQSAPAEDWSIRCMSVRDYPRFAYRGIHLDCARHFFSLEEVYRYIDIAVEHKLNRLHWHLTDDQGWRIEIKKYPKLTTVGGFRNGTMIGHDWSSDDHIRYGGYYTQEELKAVVAYAAQRGMTIIPEIDLPGHMQAVLAAYPKLGCTGGPYEVRKIWGVSDDVLCAGNEKTYELLEDILTELMDIFPSEYIHIGGDECPKVRWHDCPKCQKKIKELGLKDDDHFKAEDYLQSYVMNRVETFLNNHGRKIIGWDEVLEGNVSQSATIMSWRGAAGGIKAAQSGRDAIMTPNSYLYFDYGQSKNAKDEPLNIGGHISVARVYEYEPYDEQMTPEECKHILGAQANLWSEYLSENEHLEYMLLPRLSALSEVQWCKPERKNWDRFEASMQNMKRIYDAQGYTYATHMFDGRMKAEEVNAAKISHKAVGKKAECLTRPHLNYTFHAPDELFDGLTGDESFTSGAWIGWEGEPMDVVVKLGGKTIESVTIDALVNKGAWIYNPTSLKVSASKDGKNFTELASSTFPEEVADDPEGVKQYTVSFPATKVKYLRVEAGTVSALPAWHAGAGLKAFIFIDEVIVK